MIDLVHVDFNVTNACNLACSHCHSSSGQALPAELSTDEIIKAVHQLHDHGVLSIAFAGGEPFMHPGLLEILKEACSLDGWRVSVITNGLFFTDRMLGQLAQCNELGINVSIDGSTPATFAELRAQPRASANAKAALFRRVTEGVRRCAESGLQVSVNTTMTRATIADLVPTYRLATEQLGAVAQVAIKFFPAGYGRDHLERYEFPWEIWAAEFERLTRLKLAGDLELMQLSVPTAWEFYLPLIQAGIDIARAESAWGYQSPLRQAHYAKSRTLGDVAGVHEVCVSGDGSVYPSILMLGDPSMNCGSIQNSSFEDIWSRSPALVALRDLGVHELDAKCSSCSLVGICGGGSRSRALADSGRLNAADRLCPLIRSSSKVVGTTI